MPRELYAGNNNYTRIILITLLENKQIPANSRAELRKGDRQGYCTRTTVRALGRSPAKPSP